MTGFIDKMKDKAQAAAGDDHARLKELEHKQAEGKLDDSDRAELMRLRDHFRGTENR